jgi:hypothetical protein
VGKRRKTGNRKKDREPEERQGTGRKTGDRKKDRGPRKSKLPGAVAVDERRKVGGGQQLREPWGSARNGVGETKQDLFASEGPKRP